MARIDADGKLLLRARDLEPASALRGRQTDGIIYVVAGDYWCGDAEGWQRLPTPKCCQLRPI